MKIIILCLVSALVSGCGGASGGRDTALEARVATLELRLSTFEQSNKQLTSELSNLKFQQEISEWEKVAFMKPGDSGYSALRFDLGVVTVKLADVKAYANGSKVTLNFGNLSSARIDGLKAKLDWGKVDDKGIAQNDAAKTRDVTFNEPLLAGSWSNAEVVLEGIPPTELGFVRLHQVGHRGIGLRR